MHVWVCFDFFTTIDSTNLPSSSRLRVEGQEGRYRHGRGVGEDLRAEAKPAKPAKEIHPGKVETKKQRRETWGQTTND